MGSLPYNSFFFLFIDLRVHRGTTKNTFVIDVVWSIIWIATGLLFGIYIYWHYGHEEGLKYLTAYIVEKSLSVDNLFVFLVIFSYFAVLPRAQHKTLFLGILGAIILRAIFIFLGVTLIERFHWVVYIFGAILMYSGYKLLTKKEETIDLEKNKIVGVAKRILPLYPKYVDEKFLVRNDGKLLFTPLIIVLIAIETTDIIFAVDSVPAVLAITREFFTAYTSNIMAILGLRSLYFVLAHILRQLKYLSTGLAIILFYLGAKFLAIAFGIEISTLVSLAIIVIILLVCIMVSWKLKHTNHIMICL